MRVTFPKPPEQMTYNDYTKAYLRAMFRSQGLSDVTDDEIAMFQARLGRAVGDNFGLNHAANREAMAQRYREVQRTNGDEVVWATNERGRAYVDAGMRDIFRERQARTERMEQNRQQAQHESTEMLLDSGRVMANSAISLGNVTLQFLSMQPEHVPGLRTEDGERVPNPAVPQIPRLEYQSEMFRRDGRTIEVGTTLGLAALSGPRSASSPQTLNLGRAEAGAARTVETATAETTATNTMLRQGVDANLVRELGRAGVRHTPENIVRIARTQEGRIVFLETGDVRAGLQHIMRHVREFADRGISEQQIPDAVMTAVTRGRIIGNQGQGTSRAVYEFTFNGRTQHLSVTIGDNGFIVGANPTPRPMINSLTGGRN